MQTTKGIAELRSLAFHVQLGRGLCAAFIAQQQGIALSTALKKVEEPIGDLWLVLSEFARQGCLEDSIAEMHRLRRDRYMPVM
jgi:hypothetical protein